MDVSFVQNTKYESVCTKLMISQVDMGRFHEKSCSYFGFCRILVGLGSIKKKASNIGILAAYTTCYVRDTKDRKGSEIPKTISTCVRSKAIDKISFNINTRSADQIWNCSRDLSEPGNPV